MKYVDDPTTLPDAPQDTTSEGTGTAGSKSLIALLEALSYWYPRHINSTSETDNVLADAWEAFEGLPHRWTNHYSSAERAIMRQNWLRLLDPQPLGREPWERG